MEKATFEAVSVSNVLPTLVNWKCLVVHILMHASKEAVAELVA